jgi:hypothetical protein
VFSISRIVDDENIAVWVEAYTGSHDVMSWGKDVSPEPLEVLYTTL